MFTLIEFHLELQNLNSNLEFCESECLIFTKFMKSFPERLIHIIPHGDRATAKSLLTPNPADLLLSPILLQSNVRGFLGWKEGGGASEG